jgi:hypothetical protein
MTSDHFDDIIIGCIYSAPWAILTINMIFMIRVYHSMLHPLQYVHHPCIPFYAASAAVCATRQRSCRGRMVARKPSSHPTHATAAQDDTACRTLWSWLSWDLPDQSPPPPNSRVAHGYQAVEYLQALLSSHGSYQHARSRATWKHRYSQAH